MLDATPFGESLGVVGVAVAAMPDGVQPLVAAAAAAGGDGVAPMPGRLSASPRLRSVFSQPCLFHQCFHIQRGKRLGGLSVHAWVFQHFA